MISREMREGKEMTGKGVREGREIREGERGGK